VSGRDTIARALELARTGSVRTINEIRTALIKEKCDAVHDHLAGGAIQKQLRAAIDARLASETG
jgi:hypothetical protein